MNIIVDQTDDNQDGDAEREAERLHLAGCPDCMFAWPDARSTCIAHYRALGAIVADRMVAARADAWPCDNYRAPSTCLTAPSSKTGRCKFCLAQAEAARRGRTARAVERPSGDR